MKQSDEIWALRVKWEKRGTLYVLPYMAHTWMAFDPFLVPSCEARVLSSWVIYFMFCKCELVWASRYGVSLTPQEEQCREGKSLPCRTEDFQTESTQ